jgi:hypothetical protein
MKRRICQPTLPANPASPSFPSPILGCLPSFRVSTVLPAGASSCTGHQPFSLPSFLPWMPFADPPRDTTAPTTSFDPSDAARTLMSRTKTLTIWVSRSKKHAAIHGGLHAEGPSSSLRRSMLNPPNGLPAQGCRWNIKPGRKLPRLFSSPLSVATLLYPP